MMMSTTAGNPVDAETCDDNSGSSRSKLHTAVSSLSEGDASLLKSSPLDVLPHDDRCRQVYILDTSKIDASVSHQASDIRSIFYALQHSLQSMDTTSLSSPSDGIVLIVHVPDYRAINDEDVNRLEKITKFLLEMIGDTMPLPLRRLHMVSQDCQNNSSLITSCIKLAIEKQLSDECVATCATSPKGLLCKLKQFGLSEHGLPSALGGTYSPPLYSAAGRKNEGQEGEASIPAAAGSGPASASEDAGSSQLDDSIHSTVDDATLLKRKRERNALYSRRKYHRTKIELQVREQEVKRAKIENANLKEEQQRLTSLLGLAKQTIQMHESSVARMPPGETQQQAGSYSSPTMMWLAQARILQQQPHNSDLDRKPAATTMPAASVPPVQRAAATGGGLSLGQLAAAASMTPSAAAAVGTPSASTYLHAGYGGHAQQLSGHSASGTTVASGSNLSNPLLSLFANRAAASASTQGSAFSNTTTPSSSAAPAPENTLNILNQLLGILGGAEGQRATVPQAGMPPVPPSDSSNIAGSHPGGWTTGTGTLGGGGLSNRASILSGQTIEDILSSMTTAPASSTPTTPANPLLINSQFQPLFAVSRTAATASSDDRGGLMQSSQASASGQLNALKAPALRQGGSAHSSSSDESNDEEAGKKPAATR